MEREMKKLVLKRNSWHYHLAKNYGNLKHYYGGYYGENLTLCEYTWCMFKGLLFIGAVLFFVGLIFGILSFPILDSMVHYVPNVNWTYWQFLFVFLGFHLAHLGVIAVCGLIAIMGVGVIIWFFEDFVPNIFIAKFEEPRLDRPPSVLRERFRDFKDNVCRLIEFK